MNEKWAIELIADLVKRFDEARRDEGAFPHGHIKAAVSEHRLWLTMQEAKQFLAQELRGTQD